MKASDKLGIPTPLSLPSVWIFTWCSVTKRIGKLNPISQHSTFMPSVLYVIPDLPRFNFSVFIASKRFQTNWPNIRFSKFVNQGENLQLSATMRTKSDEQRSLQPCGSEKLWPATRWNRERRHD